MNSTLQGANRTMQQPTKEKRIENGCVVIRREKKLLGSGAHTTSSSPRAKKRDREDSAMMDVDEHKRARRGGNQTVEVECEENLIAGLADQSCESQ